MNGFCTDFLANFLADFLAGLLVGGGVAWWIGKRLNDFARVQQQRHERKAELKKAVSYLELLRVEVENLIRLLPDWTRAFRETGWGREFWIPTPCWNVLQPSGELPKLFDPSLLEALAVFYDQLLSAKRAKDLLVGSWFVPQSYTVAGMELKQQTFIEMTLTGLERAHLSGKDLPGRLDLEIKTLQKQIEAL